MEWRNQSYSRY